MCAAVAYAWFGSFVLFLTLCFFLHLPAIFLVIGPPITVVVVAALFAKAKYDASRFD